MKPSEEPLISVIIPIYNVEQYLKRCIDSVLSQTYTNLEIWLVDDGSTDGCGGICDEYAEKDGRIKVIHKENRGQAEARDAALDKMTGEYVTYVDSDDFTRNDMIEKLLEVLSESDADMAVCGFESGKDDSFKSKEKSDYAVTIWNDDTKYDCLFDDKYRNFIACPCGKLYKSNIFESIRYPAGKIYEDEFTIHYIIEKCNRIVFIDERLYYHFERKGSTTRSGYSLRSLDAVEAMEDRCGFFEAIGDKYLIMRCYKEYLRRVQYHYYSLKKYFPNLNEKIEWIWNGYKEKYKFVYKQITVTERIRYGLFCAMPNANLFFRSVVGAKKI